MQYPFASYEMDDSTNTIVCNLMETANGWRLQMVLPKNVPADDRIIMLEWLTAYRDKVMQEHPSWWTSIRGTDPEYYLDIWPTNEPTDGIANSILAIQEELGERTIYA